MGVVRCELDAKADVVVNERRSNDSPSKDTTAEEGDGSVKTDKYTSSDEGRSPLDQPAPVLDGESLVVVFAPDEEPNLIVEPAMNLF